LKKQTKACFFIQIEEAVPKSGILEQHTGVIVSASRKLSIEIAACAA
jgi:hypothetical protein